MVKGSHFVPVNKTNVYRSDFGTESLLKVKPNTYIIRNVNKASNWQIVTQIKKFSDLCDRICLYRQNYTRPAYAYLGSCGLFKLI